MKINWIKFSEDRINNRFTFLDDRNEVINSQAGIKRYGPKLGRILKFLHIAEKLELQSGNIIYVKKKNFRNWMASQLPPNDKRVSIEMMWGECLKVLKPVKPSNKTSPPPSSNEESVEEEPAVLKPSTTSSSPSPAASSKEESVKGEPAVLKPSTTSSSPSPAASSKEESVKEEPAVLKPSTTSSSTSPAASSKEESVKGEPAVLKPSTTSSSPSPAPSSNEESVKEEPVVLKPSTTSSSPSPAAPLTTASVEKKPIVYTIEGLSNPKKPNQQILIPIGSCNGLTLTEENLPEIFHIANQHTINVQYPCQNTSKMFDGRLVHRPNHNGTHSARQFRYIGVLFDLIDKSGTELGKRQLNSLTNEEKLNLKLAAFFLRAGRVDETNFAHYPADPNKERSAQVYRAYAEQLRVAPAIIEWVEKLICDSCMPENLCQEANNNPKSKFCYDLLTVAHEIDLVRCFNRSIIEKHKPGVVTHLAGHVNDAEFHVDRLYTYSLKACEKTGVHIAYLHQHAQGELFADCSLDAKKCFEVLKALPF